MASLGPRRAESTVRCVSKADSGHTCGEKGPQDGLEAARELRCFAVLSSAEPTGRSGAEMSPVKRPDL